MKMETLVILIGTDGFMPPISSIGEIVEDFDGLDFGVLFPHFPCPAGPEIYWYIPPSMLRPVSGLPLQEDEQTEIKVLA